MKLTATLVTSAASYTNALTQRQLDLRNLQIPLIENLGAARDIHDVLDLTANDLRYLGNFPRMPRVKTLLLANNRIAKIDARLSDALPGLEMVVLTGNAVAQLATLEGLRGCRRLEWLSLLGCPVTRVAGYREWVVWRFPRVRVLDFQRVRDKERAAAREMYGETHDTPTAAAQAIVRAAATAVPHTDADGSSGGGAVPVMSAADQERIRRAIREAKTLDEVQRLEAELRSGRVPPSDGMRE